MQLSRLNIISAVTLLLLGGGIALTVNLAQQNQENRSRASSTSITYVQSNLKKNNTNITSLTLTQSVTPGNLLVVSAGNYEGSLSVSDNRGDTFQTAAVQPANASSGQVGIFYAANAVGGSTTITVRSSAGSSVTSVSIAVHEYSGVLQLNPLDKASSAAGSSSSIGSGSVTTTQANDLVVSAGSFDNQTSTSVSPANGFSLRQVNADGSGYYTPVFTEDQIVSGIGTYAGGFSSSRSVNWKGAIAAFKATAPTEVPTATPVPLPTVTPPQPTATSVPTDIPIPTQIAGVTPTTIIPTPTNFAQATATPIVTAIPVPTALTGTTSLRLSLRLHGIGSGGDNVNPNSTGNFSPVHAIRNVTVDIYDVNNQLVVSKQGTVSFDATGGTFIGNVDLGVGFATGSYTVKVKADQYLRTLLPGIQTITTNQSNVLPSVALITGDSNNDNQVNIVDYNILIGCYSDLQAAVDCSAANSVLADLTDDGHVNQFDYNLFLRELTNVGGQ